MTFTMVRQVRAGQVRAGQVRTSRAMVPPASKTYKAKWEVEKRPIVRRTAL